MTSQEEVVHDIPDRSDTQLDRPAVPDQGRSMEPNGIVGIRDRLVGWPEEIELELGMVEDAIEGVTPHDGVAVHEG